MEFIIFIYIIGAILSSITVHKYAQDNHWSSEDTLGGTLLAGSLSWIYVIIVEYNKYKSLND